MYGYEQDTLRAILWVLYNEGVSGGLPFFSFRGNLFGREGFAETVRVR